MSREFDSEEKVTGQTTYVIGADLLPERDYVTFGSLLSQIRVSSVVVCNVRAPYSRG